MKEPLKILIPMAGLGTRLRPHTWSKPKPLVQVAGKTVLSHLLDGFASLPDAENIELVFIIGYLGEQVPEYMAKEYPGVKAHYVTQPEMQGQSQALWLAREYLQGPVMVVFADTLAETDFSMVGREDVDGYAWVKSVPDPRRFGVAEVDSAGYITRLVEKPTEMDNNRVVIGLYHYRQGEKLLRAIEEQLASGAMFKGEYFLTDATTIYIRNGARMKTMEVGSWLDAGTTPALLETNRHLLERNAPHLPPLDASVKIIQPVAIHPQAIVRNSTIGPYVSLAAGCAVEDSLLTDCIVDSGTTITHSILSSSLVGRNVLVEDFKGTLDLGDNSSILKKKTKS